MCIFQSILALKSPSHINKMHSELFLQHVSWLIYTDRVIKMITSLWFIFQVKKKEV